VLQSLFDEFDELRVRKQEVTFGLIGVLAFSSFFFCTNVSTNLINLQYINKKYNDLSLFRDILNSLKNYKGFHFKLRIVKTKIFLAAWHNTFCRVES